MRFLFLLFLFCSSILSSQVVDNFTDADFLNNPVWSGDSTDWTIVNGQLRSNSTTPSCGFYLSTPSSLAANAQWEFYVNLKLQTSSANYTDIYLTSDEANLKSTGNSGYFVRIGNTSDEISLYKRINGSNTEIIDGLDAEVNSSNNTLQIKVTRTANNLWTLQSNVLGDGFSYITEGTTIDSSITSSAYFGIFVQQSTATFHLSHYYDNFYVGPIITDSISPSILSTTIISNKELDVLFSEPLDLISSQTTTNYFADNNIGNPITAARDLSNFNLIHLTFANAFPDGVTNTLSIYNVQDLSTNSCNLSGQFTFITPVFAKFKDIIINEIFADPSPQIGLPNSEFIEIFNKSESAIDLSGWKFTDGSSSATLGNSILSPNQYLIICSRTDTADFKAFNNVMGVSSFPILNNAGDHLYLKNNELTIIDSVIYSDTWYQDETKKEGGWSLELIDPNANTNCPASNYWIASNNNSGGTPGKINSNYSTNTDKAPLKLIDATIISKDSIQIHFNKALDMSTCLNTSLYSIDNGIGMPVQVKVLDADLKSLLIITGTKLEEGITHTIHLDNSITDCSGIHIGSNTWANFVIPESALPNDILINEILFDPNDEGVDFVEIYNRSNKIIDMKTITISQYDTIHNVLISINEITSESYLIRPGEYILISENGAAVRSQYKTKNPKGFLDIANLPSMNISSGTVCLAISGTIIDLLKYTAGMHFPLLNDTKGVSLERIDFNRPTQDLSNWHSTAESVGFATPAYQNSQYNAIGKNDDPIETSPTLFSPDEDGLNDIININYHFDTPGLIANMTIYDSKGRTTKQLVHRELLGTTGTFSWDGINNDREKAKIGIYVLFVEVFNLDGDVKHYKKTFVLAGKL